MLSNMFFIVNKIKSRILRFLLYFLIYFLLTCIGIGALILFLALLVKYPLAVLIAIAVLLVISFIGFLAWEESK